MTEVCRVPSKSLGRNVFASPQDAAVDAHATLNLGADYYVWKLFAGEWDWTAIPQPPIAAAQIEPHYSSPLEPEAAQ